MRMPERVPREPGQTAALALLALAATLVLVAAGGGGAGEPAPRLVASWQGLAGGPRPRVALGQRMLVVLRSPSLADRVERVGGLATDAQERRWTSAALASQNLLISRLGLQGVRVRTEFRYTRVLNGFSAPLDAQAIALLERAPEVAGVYQVRAAYPATLSSAALRKALFQPGSGHRVDVSVPGYDGRGVTVALLDTGVDRAQPYLRGRVLQGVDIVGGNEYALAVPKPDDPTQLEQHGTQMAGLVVGAGGPYGLSGVATGASILPIRVAGWQQDAAGGWSVYARSDQVVAGLESAVDPNGDGDAHDAARIALVALAEPYAAFADDPVARAAAGALRLDTLVVAAAGNDGPGGPAFGLVSGPGGAPAALTVGAADLRRSTQRVRVAIRIGLNVLLDRLVPLGGAVAPDAPLSLTAAAPGRTASSAATAAGGAPPLQAFFDGRGLSRVADRAAVVAGGDEPGVAVEHAARAGAAAVLVHGGSLPAGALGLDEDAAVPTVAIPDATARTILAALRDGREVGVSIGRARSTPNAARGEVAPFSSTGLAFDGRVKPELVAPGVALATSDAGADALGAPRFATVNGSSAAAAVVAGAAALLAQARPQLGGSELRSLLAETARPLRDAPLTTQGAGLVDPGAASAAELAVEPASLALGRASGAGWEGRQSLLVRNLSTRAVTVRIRIAHASEGAAPVRFSARPARLRLGRGESATIDLRASVAGAPVGRAPAAGTILVEALGDPPLRLPWTITFGTPPRDLLGALSLRPGGNAPFEPGKRPSFHPSDRTPALLSFRAGRVVRSVGRDSIRPLERLDISLWSARGVRLGLLARLRDVLPGRFQFGLTGRSPAGARLARGLYQLRVVAKPTEPGPSSTRSVTFRIR